MEKRDLTMQGKKLLISSYIMSSLSYLIDVYITDISQNVIKQTKELIADFLWSGKTWRISQKSLALKKCHGGLELPDIDNFIKCKKLKWIIRINYSQLSPWNAFGKFCIHKYDLKFGIQNFLLKCTNLKGLNTKLPQFYQVCIEEWCDFGKKHTVVCKKDVMEQNIFGNNMIAKRSQSLFYPNWCKSNFIKIKDIWNPVTNNWKNAIDIYTNLVPKNNWIAEFSKIKNYVPSEWKKILKQEVVEIRQADLQNPKELYLLHDQISLNGKEINFKKLKQKDVYNACLYPTTPPTCIAAWKKIMNEELTLKDIFIDICQYIHNKKCYNFHWNVLHRAIYSEKRLQLMNKSDGVCKTCNATDETIIHLISECSHILPIWESIQHVVEIITTHSLSFSIKHKVFGLEKEHENLSIEVTMLCNFIILETKWAIWKQRNIVKMNPAKKLNHNQLCKIIIESCQRNLSVLLGSNTKQKLCDQSVELFEKLINFNNV